MLDLIAELDDDVVGASPMPTVPSIGFHVWHSGRWADVVRATLLAAEPMHRCRCATREELWTADGWNVRFGCSDLGPGYRGTGMGAEPAEFAGMMFRDRSLVHGYAAATFDALDELTALLDAEMLALRCPSAYGYDSSVAWSLIAHISHVGRHLGSVETMIGLTGRSGTASS